MLTTVAVISRGPEREKTLCRFYQSRRNPGREQRNASTRNKEK
jgi:hypothetical protein